jgi:DNA-binding CsgD family transcriptional regulator
MAADLIGVLEASYELDGAEEAWLERVAGAMHPVIDRGMGTAGYFFSLGEQGVAIGAATARGIAMGVTVEKMLQEMSAALPPELARRMFVDVPPCSNSARAMGMSLRRHRISKRILIPRLDVPDFIGVRANSGPRQGVLFTTPSPKMGSLSPRETALLSRVASHIGAGLRLRRRLAAEARARLDDAEAILTPSGKLEHAAGPAEDARARAALAGAARALDRARGRLRRADPDEAVTLWRALVSGQWSLVDHFDHDGRRYVVAHRNQMLDARPRLLALSERERQAAVLAALGHGNKLIAYDLGISPAAVAIYLSRAAAKLGASSRVSLIQILKSIQH